VKRLALVSVMVLLVVASVVAAPNTTVVAPGNMLELREPLGNVKAIYTATDLDGLASGNVTTPLGTTIYSQTLQLGNTTNGLQPAAVNFIRNDSDIMDDYLVVDANQPFLEWNLTFSPGLASSATFVSGNTYRLAGLEGVKIPLLGTNYTIIHATIWNVTGLPLHLVLVRSDPVTDSLYPGQGRSYTINGTRYDVTLLSSSASNATFMVGNQMSQALAADGSQILNATTALYVRQTNASGATFLLFNPSGFIIIDMPDTLGTTFGGSIKVNNTSVVDGQMEIAGGLTSGTVAAPGGFNLTRISYQLTMDATTSATAYVSVGHGIREYMHHPEELLGADFDIEFPSILWPVSAEFRLSASGSQYVFNYLNTLVELYSNSIITNESGILRFVGLGGDDFVFVEAASNTSYNIGLSDYFVVTSDPWNPNSVSKILRYNDYDNVTDTVSFTDITDDSSIQTVITDGVGQLIQGGHSYSVYAENWNGSPPHRLAIDQNGDGSVNGSKVGVSIYGGGLFDFAAAFANSSGGITAPSSLNDVDGDGLNITNANTSWTNGVATAVRMQLRTLASKFETQNGDETLNWSVGTADWGGLDLSITSSGYHGPNSGGNLWNEFTIDNPYPGSGSRIGFTDYGVLVVDSPGSGNVSKNLTIYYPVQELNATVVVVMSASVPLVAATLPSLLSLSVTNGAAIYGSTFWFNVTVGNDTAAINYTISNGTAVWSNGTLATRSTVSDPISFSSPTFNGIYLPAGNWTLNVTAKTFTNTSLSATSTLTSYPAILPSLTSFASQSTAIGGDNVSFSFLTTVKSAGSVVEAYLLLASGPYTFDAGNYARLSSLATNLSVAVSGKGDYTGAGNVTIPVITSRATPSYVTMNLTASGQIRQDTLTLTLTPYNSLVPGTYKGSYGFGVFG
jgi:hypothetical protein